MLTLEATDKAYHPRARALFDQINRSVVSIEANIVEGFGSAAETEALVLASVERGYLPESPEIILGSAKRCAP